MYNYLELVNDVNKRLNEVTLSSGSFANATGFASDVKNYVNGALNRINIEEFEWPFNHAVYNQLLTPDVTEYPLPPDTKSIALDTFRVAGDDTLRIRTVRLRPLDYEEYLEKRGDEEFMPDKYRDTPSNVVRTRGLSYIISPPPDQAYNLRFEYYRLPSDLVNWDDVPTVPAQFRWVILEGALYDAYMFRGAVEEATFANQRFQAGLADMRKLYINRTEYVRSSMV